MTLVDRLIPNHNVETNRLACTNQGLVHALTGISTRALALACLDAFAGGLVAFRIHPCALRRPRDADSRHFRHSTQCFFNSAGAPTAHHFGVDLQVMDRHNVRAGIRRVFVVFVACCKAVLLSLKQTIVVQFCGTVWPQLRNDNANSSENSDTT
jgi:hypothetical protein